MFKLAIFYFLISITALKANAAGPEYNNFLVKQQPQPAGLILTQDLITTKSDLRLKNNTSDDFSVHHKRTLLDASPIFINNSPTSFSVLGGGYMREQFSTLQGSELSKYYSGTYVSVYAISEINPNWYWNGYISYGNFSEENINFSSKSAKSYSYATLAFKGNSRQVYKFGILHNSNFGEDKLFPTVGLSYSYDSYVLDALLPSYISVRKIHSRKFHSIFKTEFLYASYYDHNKKDILEITGIDTSVVIEYNIYPTVWLQFGGTYASERQLTWLKSDEEFVIITDGFKLNCGITVRF